MGMVFSEAGSSPSDRGNEYGWVNIKTALERYKEIYGNFTIPGSFVVPGEGEWPASVWGMKLGAVLHSIRNGGQYKVRHCTDMH